jgi:uncharacterized BrkB/YihY/UPF0761 family membrane protein
MVLAALLLNLLGPLIEWGLQVAGHSVRALSLGWVDGVGLIVVLTQILPISLMFYLLVRWSAGRVGKRRLAFTAWLFGLLWALGQRLFTLYVKSVVDMDAVYGALTGVVALLLWLFYANLAFLFTVAVVAALDGRRRRRHFATRMQTDLQLIDGEGDADADPSPQASSTDPTGLPSDNTASVTGVTHASP